MVKSADAFRTISEVSYLLSTPAHVLRFWETKFSQIKPVKRAGGRRYYRPTDVNLIAGIKKLLHDDGITIRGVQKILREKGVKYVAALQKKPKETLEVASAPAKSKAKKFYKPDTQAKIPEDQTGPLELLSSIEKAQQPSVSDTAQESRKDDCPIPQKPKSTLGSQISLFDDLPFDPPVKTPLVATPSVISDTDNRTDDYLVPEIAAQLAQTAPNNSSGEPTLSSKTNLTDLQDQNDCANELLSGPLHYLSEVDELQPSQRSQLPRLRDRLSDIFPDQA